MDTDFGVFDRSSCSLLEFIEWRNQFLCLSVQRKFNLREVILFQRNLAQIDNSTVWLSSVEIQKQIEKGEVWDLNYTFSLKKGHMSNAGVGIEFKFENWDTSNQVFVPAPSITATGSGR